MTPSRLPPSHVAIGIRAAEGSATLDLLRKNTPQPHSFHSVGPTLTGPASLNWLAAHSTEPIIILLEPGLLVAPHWLERLLAALDASPTHGLAGPSTNWCWNEQGAFPQISSTALDQAATQAVQRYGSTWRTLEPLHSLNDFCYAVRREVIDTIGPADEGYLDGPCWEMDFNIRAARAGYKGVWACGSFVYRPPRSAQYSATLFEANKHRYQDKFCGLRLAGKKSDYRAHCRGDACPNFAPPVTIKSSITVSTPLASCIMPTANRRRFIPEAIRLFQAQDYPNRELIILDDGKDGIRDLIPSADAKIRYERLQPGLTLGAKRDAACRMARGEYIVHWDDDDWYPPNRVSRQIRALRESRADVCGTSALYYRDVQRGAAFKYQFHGETPWVGGNTLTYRRAFWESKHFADLQTGEDCRFLWSSPRPTIVDLADPGLCIAAIHDANVSFKDTSGPYWKPVDLETPRRLIAQTQPLISCLMPTRNRRAFIPLALKWFAAQTYANRELIVVDDGLEAVRDLVEAAPATIYIRLDRQLSIGAKRNLACGRAGGAIVVHWDDDDWYSPDRLALQAQPLLDKRAEISGLVNRFVLDMATSRVWTTTDALHRRMFVGDVHGGTLMFSRDIWARDGVRYPDVNLAEDAAFLRLAQARGARLERVENNGAFVYVRHSKNAWRFDSGQFLDPQGWRESALPREFTSVDLNRVREAAISLI